MHLNRSRVKLDTLLLFFILTGCGSGSSSTGSSTTFAISGNLKGSSAAVSAKTGTSSRSKASESALTVGSKTITHVMAVNPENANPDRQLASVGSDGTFSVNVRPNRPYVLVFIDSSQIGSEMIVAIFKASTLDSLAPLKDSGEANLGDVSVSATTRTASMGISYEALLEKLGLTAEAASFLGSVDDLSLRYANPDIDGDGTIDVSQGRTYMLDFHIRANVKKGSSSGSTVTVSDMTNQYFDASGANVATPVFNLASIYAVYPASLDSTSYVASSGVSTSLQNSGALSITHANGSSANSPSTYSTLNFSSNRGFGPDYNWSTTPSLELPGSGGSPATLAYTLGAISKTLTFTHVVTRTKASLTDVGTIMPFLKINTTDGKISSLDYKWMKRDSATSWIQATLDEVKLIVNDNGGYLTLYRSAKTNSIGITIPRDAVTGSISWQKSSVNTGVSDSDFANTTPNDICSMAVSYDDKLGLRLFAGAANPNTGVTPCP